MKNLFPKPYLQSGSFGPAVVVLQAMLICLGYNSKKIIVDGDYGEETKEGVMAFQKSVKLEPDGNFGPNSRAAFLEITGIDVNKIPKIKGRMAMYLTPKKNESA